MSEEDFRPLVCLLGPVRIQSDEIATVPPRLDGTVLAHLALAEGRFVSATDLTEAVWGPAPPGGARNALQVKMSRLRRILGSKALLEHRNGSYRLVLASGAEDVDLVALTKFGSAAADALEAGRLTDAALLAEQGMRLWQGPPLEDLGEHPRLVEARHRATDARCHLGEIAAHAALESGEVLRAVKDLRDVLTVDPLRPRARLLLMRALDRQGRHAEAIAVFDVGRRLLAEQAGLAPPAEMQREFDRILRAERHERRRDSAAVASVGVPAGAMASARWLAREGAIEPALEIALRGSWWWWLGGERSAGRDLLEELVGVAAGHSAEQTAATLGAHAWLAVFDAVTAHADEAMRAGEDALTSALELGWERHHAVAALLLAERLLQRGDAQRGAVLLGAATAAFTRLQDPWGTALAGLTRAKADLQRGKVRQASMGADAARRAFDDLDDPAGQMMAMDLIGYCTEIVGDLATAERTHRRALALADALNAPEWQASQLIRLGSVRALMGAETSLATLTRAAKLAASIDSPASTALADNAIGLAHGLLGAHERAVEIHESCLDWYGDQRSSAGLSYTEARLAFELIAVSGTEAAGHARRALNLAHATADPRAIAYALEAVALTDDDAPSRARALGGARALRRRTASPLPHVLARPLRGAQQQLAEQLGDQLLPLLREGAHQTKPIRP